MTKKQAIAPWRAGTLDHDWATEAAIAKAALGLPIILVSAEQLLVRNQFWQSIHSLIMHIDPTSNLLHPICSDEFPKLRENHLPKFIHFAPIPISIVVQIDEKGCKHCASVVYLIQQTYTISCVSYQKNTYK